MSGKFKMGGRRGKVKYIPKPDPLVHDNVTYTISHESDDNGSSGFFTIESEEKKVIELFQKTYNQDLEKDVQWTREEELSLSEDKTVISIKFTSVQYCYQYHIPTKAIIAIPKSRRNYYGLKVVQYGKEYNLEFRMKCVWKSNPDTVEIWLNETVEKFGKVKELEGKIMVLEKKLDELPNKEGGMNILVSDVSADYTKKELKIETIDGNFILDENKKLIKV